MRKHIILGLGAAALTLAVSTGSAFAQGEPVGTPGEPQCHGERVAAGNQRVEDIPEIGLTDFRLTPPNRTELLNTFQVEGRSDYTVQDFQNRVRASCQAPTGG